MKRISYVLIVLISFLSCKDKEQSHKTGQPKENSNQLSIREVVKDFGDSLKSGDSLVLYFNLAMESYIRVDTLLMRKSDNEIKIKSIINEKILDLKEDFSTYKTDERTYSMRPDDSLSLEFFINKNSHRKDPKNSKVSTVKVFGKSDTLSLYTYNLSDKSRFIKQYFNTMKELFPTVHFFENGEETFPILNKSHSKPKN
jgi:hypothetical protein